MSNREEFDKWLIDEHNLVGDGDAERNCYSGFGCHLAYKAYQASDAKWQALVGGTAGYKYKSELYEEMWNKARSIGFPNVITALESISASQARVKELEDACKAAESALVTQVGRDYNKVCHEAVLMCRKLLSTTSPDQALQRRVLEDRIDNFGEGGGRKYISNNIVELRKQLEGLGKQDDMGG